jgi:hypothetical protein
MVNGKSVQRQTWQSLTIGTMDGAAPQLAVGNSSPTRREMTWWVKQLDFERWFASESKVVIRVRLEVAPEPRIFYDPLRDGA